MKTNRTFKSQLAAALLLAASQLFTARALGNPPQPGTPTQIEMPTPISYAPFTIKAPGSYYLTGNLTVHSGNAITIATNGVTLDLNGFTISSTAPSAAGTAILLNNGLHNITILNGFIQSGVTDNGSGVYQGSGFASGISWLVNAPVNVLTNVVVTKVSVMGVLDNGIFLGIGNGTIVEACTVTTAGGYGIVASIVKDSVANDCGSDGIYGDQAVDCRGTSFDNDGIETTDSAQNCVGVSTGAMGIYTSTAQNCRGFSSSGTGLTADTALNCEGDSGSNCGLAAYQALNCDGGSESGTGLSALNFAQNCYGSSSSGTGLFAQWIAQNCYGYSYSSTAMDVLYMANFSVGISSSGTGLSAFIANSCWGSGSTGLTATYGNFCFGSTVSVTTKYNMP
ncbi:MAG: hypothetical protein WBN75_09540 [Verrucomicrobiia bacterium]